MSSVHYAALRIALDRVSAQKKVDEIINNCSSFKIGKTGDALDNRLNNYNGDYDYIKMVFAGEKLKVDNMESYLIDKYLVNPKCDNKKDGLASSNDTMAKNADMYQVYIVWK